jgi:hypothetical protein
MYHEGFREAARRRALWSKILWTRPFPVMPHNPNDAVEVHLLCCRYDYLIAIWALKSFYHFASATFPLIIHLQGYFSSVAIKRLAHHFPGAKVITQRQSDQIVERLLLERRLYRLASTRRASGIMMKFTDLLLLARAPLLLILDSDLLFFRRPVSLLDEIQSERPRALFMRDYISAYALKRDAREVFGFDIAERINTGITLIEPASVSLDRCEEYLRHDEMILDSGHIEQTLYALAASEIGQVGYLPEQYLVSPFRTGISESLVARHYSGPSRPLLTSEGMSALIAKGWLRAIA